MITALAAANYRSLREVVLPLGQLTVVTGGNGVGKSNVYRALRLLADCAAGGVVSAVAHEGGLSSVAWAGNDHPRSQSRRGYSGQSTLRSGPVSVRLGFASDELGYQVDLGLAGGTDTLFSLDPEIKAETIHVGPLPRPSTLVARRRGGVATAHGPDGPVELSRALPPHRSMVAEAGDPLECPEIGSLRRRLSGWRFYDTLRTDAAAPARTPRVGTRTEALAGDGSDVAAALQTIIEVGQGDRLSEFVDRAFPGASVRVAAQDGVFTLVMFQPGITRPLTAAELSEGTLKYLMLLAALLSPRPPALLALNEPENSIHPQLVPALADLLAEASRDRQVILVTHSRELAERAARSAPLGVSVLELVKEDGATLIQGQGLLDGPPWRWEGRS